MLLGQNTRNTGNNAIKMSQAFHNITRCKLFTDLNQFNMHSMSFKTGTRMLYNILFVGAYFSIAVIVDGDESSWQRLSSKLAGGFGQLSALIDSPACRFIKYMYYTECKYGGSLGQRGSSCAKARLVRPQELCFDCACWRLSRSIRFPSSCYVLKSHQRGYLTPAETRVDYLRFAKVLYEGRNGFKRFGAANGGTLLSRS